MAKKQPNMESTETGIANHVHVVFAILYDKRCINDTLQYLKDTTLMINNLYTNARRIYFAWGVALRISRHF